MVETTSPDTGTVRFVYDEAGNLIGKTDARGIAVSYTYDDLNRLTGILFPDGAENIGYSYDGGTNGIGRRTGMSDASGTTSFGYDDRGRLVEKTSTINAIDYTISRAYSPAGRVQSVYYPSGRTVDMTRHADNGRIQAVSTTYNSDTKTLMDNLAYNPFGRPRTLDTGAGGTVDNESGECGCLERINPGQMMEQVYSYDNNGNLTQIAAANTPWFSQDFTYDTLNRLKTASGSYGDISYTYDAVGNRLTRSVDTQTDTYSYVSGSNRLEAVTGPNSASFTSDDGGSITGIDAKSFVYNQRNRLARVEEGLDILGEYEYNGQGQRVTKAAGGVTTVFLYDFDGNIVAEARADGSLVFEYLYVGGSRQVMVDHSTGSLYYYQNNYLGTPVVITDDAGVVVWEAVYSPFGQAAVNGNSEVVNRFRFAGQYYDAETGLHYNYHRYYDPATGRYLTPDPIGLAGGINLYLYAAANPTNLIDPLGLDYVNFNGQKLTWVFEKRASIFGIPMPWKKETGRKSWNARSGKSPIYDPIPSGTYTTSPLDKEYHTGEEFGWGPFSYRLHEGLMTRVFNRLEGRTGGFHIHGGYAEGTAGCVEFEDYDPAQKSLHEFDKLMQNYGKEIKVYVE